MNKHTDLANVGQARFAASISDDTEPMGGQSGSSVDLLAILPGVLRRWKLVVVIALTTTMATYGALKLVPQKYKSSVEILVYDPQRQIDSSVQKPISPFVDALGNDAMATEINVLKSKSVALRVATELGLDTDPEFESHHVSITSLLDRVGVTKLAERLGLGGRLSDLLRTYDHKAPVLTAAEEKAEKLDRAADSLIERLGIWQDSYVIHVSATARDPGKAQRLAATVANDYLVSQREARQEALGRVAKWLKGRIDNLQSRIFDTEAEIEKMTLASGIRDSDSDKVREQQIRDLNSQLMTAREEVNNKKAHLEQARQVIDTHGDIDSIPELTASTTLMELRKKKMELNWSLADLQNKLGEHNPQVVSARAALASVSRQIDDEADNILGITKNAYDIAMRRAQSLETNLQSLTANVNSETYVKLQQLRRSVEADRKDYETYLAQYNETSEQREMQSSSARIISPATLPRFADTSRIKFYALAGLGGLGGGLILAFLLEYFRPGIRTSAEIEQAFGLPVVGLVPLVPQGKGRGASRCPPLDRMIDEPFSHLSEAVHAMRIGLDLSSDSRGVFLFTSALPGEGKSTSAILLAASSAGSGKKTVLIDCDLRLRSASTALGNENSAGLSELLRGVATLSDVIREDPVTKINVIPAGAMTQNAADLLMSQKMVDLLATLRGRFDCIVMDGPPLLPVVDALALATSADKILVVIEWRRTPRASISEAFRLLGRDVNRVSGIVLNKVDFTEMPVYGDSDYHRSAARYFSNA